MIDASELTNRKDLELAGKVADAFLRNWWFNGSTDEFRVRPYAERDLIVTYHCSHEGRVRESITRIYFCVDSDRTRIRMPALQGGIWVHPDYRGQGIGGDLVKAMESAGRDVLIPEINIEGVDNSGFWSHFGYIQCGPQAFCKKLT